MHDDAAFGTWLKQHRKALDLTQRDLARQVGCAPVTIHKIETGARRPSRQFAERLAQALGIPASEQMAFVTLARGVTATAPPTLAAPSHNLPPSPTTLVGRGEDLARISQHLGEPGCRLLTLVGPGGIGKTRLAVEAARRKLPDFGQGIYFIPLASVSAPEFVASAIASAIGFAFYGQLAPETQLVNHLRGKTMLLVLDNFEHLLAKVDLVGNILANAPGIKLLVTSRERLKLQEEWLLDITGLPFPGRADLQDALKFSAVQLFVERARQVKADFSLGEDPEAVADICRTMAGMPLGIELAAACLRVMPCDRIAQQIARDLKSLTSDVRNLPERHRSLQAVFEQSWKLLTSEEQRGLMKLSVFQGGFQAEAAERVADISPATLAALVDKSMVQSTSARRYSIHDFIQRCALEKLTSSFGLE